MPSGRHGTYSYWECFEVTIDVCAATRNYYFYTGVPYRFEQLQYAADAVDSTDKFTPELSYKGPNDSGFTVISTGTVCSTADTITTYTTLDSTAPLDGIVPAGSTIRITLTLAGTAANVKGVSCAARFSLAH